MSGVRTRAALTRPESARDRRGSQALRSRTRSGARPPQTAAASCAMPRYGRAHDERSCRITKHLAASCRARCQGARDASLARRDGLDGADRASGTRSPRACRLAMRLDRAASQEASREISGVRDNKRSGALQDGTRRAAARRSHAVAPAARGRCHRSCGRPACHWCKMQRAARDGGGPRALHLAEAARWPQERWAWARAMGAGWACVPSLELSHTSATMSGRGLTSGALSEGAGLSCEGELTRPSMAGAACIVQ